MSRMTLSYADLYTKVSNFLGMTDSGTAPTGTDLTTCQGIIQRGIRQFLYPLDMKYGTPHYWSFLNQYWSFSTAAGQWKYTLPIDFSDLVEGFDFENDEGLPALKKSDGQQIIHMKSITAYTGWPQYYAVVPSKYSVDLGTTYELWLYPTPGQAYTFSTFYRIDPVKLSATTELVVGGISATEAILESCLAVAEHDDDDNASTHHQAKAEELIQKLIRFDSGKTVTEKIGNLYQDRFPEPDERTLFLRDIDLTTMIYADER